MGYITGGSMCIGRGYNLSPIYRVYHWGSVCIGRGYNLSPIYGVYHWG